MSEEKAMKSTIPALDQILFEASRIKSNSIDRIGILERIKQQSLVEK